MSTSSIWNASREHQGAVPLQSRSERYPALDALRGIAALTVVFDHLLSTLPAVFDERGVSGLGLLLVTVLNYTPVHVFFAGHQAVLLFFILSGFVLSLPFFDGTGGPYLIFAIKRMCRIYIPYAVTIALATSALLLSHRSGPAGTSSWFTPVWTHTPTIPDLLGHFSLVASFNTRLIDPPVWSLVLEMRASLLFPLLVLIVLRIGAIRSLVGFLALMVLGFGSTVALQARLHYQTDYLDTLGYMYLFVLGIVLAQWRTSIISWFTALPSGLRLIWVPLAIVVYTYPYLFHTLRLAHYAPEDTVISSVGAAMILLAALASPSVKRWLCAGPALYLGKISYSLYLIHVVVLMTAFSLLNGRIPTVPLILLVLVASLVTAAFLHRYVEVPSIALGRQFARQFSHRPRGSHFVPVPRLDDAVPTDSGSALR